MARDKQGERVRGPYYKAGGRKRPWRIRYYPPDDGAPVDRYFATKEQAEEFKAEVAEELRENVERTIKEAVAAYWQYLAAKGNKKGSITRTKWSLGKFFDFEDETPLDMIRTRRLQRRYDELTGEVAVDSHRNALAELKTFYRWCVSKGLVKKNMAEPIEGMGRRNHGKPQLRVSENRRWLATAITLADQGDKGAVAAMMALLLGLRATEITLRTVRDVDMYDKPGDTLWIPDTKTTKGRRHLEVPEILQPYLVQLSQGRPRDAWLFPARDPDKTHWKDWPNDQVHRICELSGVPDVCAQSMRGAHATIAFQRGVTGPVVAASLGHADESTTRTSYAEPRADEAAKRRAMYKVLLGGVSEKDLNGERDL